MRLDIKINVWSQVKQKCVFFTHLKLWVSVARHNLKWVKIENEVIPNATLIELNTCI